MVGELKFPHLLANRARAKKWNEMGQNGTETEITHERGRPKAWAGCYKPAYRLWRRRD